MVNGEDTNEFFVPPPVPSTLSYPPPTVYSADEYGTQPQVPLPPPPVAYQQPMVNDYVTRSDALLYGKACRQHANAWNTAVWGIFLLGVILGPTSIVHTFTARRNANRSKVGKVGVGPAILGVLVTVWGAFVMWTVFHFVTTTLPQWEQQIREKMSTSQLVPNGGNTNNTGSLEELLKSLQELQQLNNNNPNLGQ